MTFDNKDQPPATVGGSDSTIYLALTHDWELRGDGSGDIEKIQFAPLRKLLEIYRKHGARTTFLPDVMQQLAFRRFENEHSELKPLANAWDEHVREAFRQGHDIQLHLHPQWRDAHYENVHWRLNGDWSIINYDRDCAYSMLSDCKQYLENLLRSFDRNYRCLAFRAGALAAAPSDHLFESLADIGIQLDVSIAPGLVVNDQNLKLDYGNCEEDFLPYYPSIEDARKVSRQREKIVCVPLNHFYGSRREVTRQNISLVGKRIKSGAVRDHEWSASQDRANKSPSKSRLGLAVEKLIKPAIKRKYFVSDTGRLNYPLMREMLGSLRERAHDSGLAQVPVVLTNHPKDTRDWRAIERFVGDVSAAEDTKFVTLAEVVSKLQNGEFQIRRAL